MRFIGTVDDLYRILSQKNLSLINIYDEKSSEKNSQSVSFGLLGISWDGNNIAIKITGLDKNSKSMYCFLEIKTNKLGFIEKLKSEMELFLEDLSEGLMHSFI